MLNRLTTIALCLSFAVIMLGAYTRLTDAGLGCPDWPGCYGNLVISKNAALHHPLELTKAWTEMIHRYFAGSLGCLLICIAILAYRTPNIRTAIPCFLLGLLIFQAALGMWTVTLKLLPIVVMGHLLGGMLIFGNLVYFRWQLSAKQPLSTYPVYLINIGIIIVFFTNCTRWMGQLKLCRIGMHRFSDLQWYMASCTGFSSCLSSVLD